MPTATAPGRRVPQRFFVQDRFPFLDGIPNSRLRVRRGCSLFDPGDAFSGLYPIRFGSFKTRAFDREGRQQVIGFHMQGDVLGLDGIPAERHDVGAIALEDSEVFVSPFASIEEAARADRSLQRYLHTLLARDIADNHNAMLMLGSLTASQKLAAFLLGLSEKYLRLGFSPTEFHLRMTRADIASYLGLKIETVSRTFAAFANQGLVAVENKHVRIADLSGLEHV